MKFLRYIVLSLFVFTACNGGGTLQKEDEGELGGVQKLKVVATTGMVGDVVKNVGGDLVEVEVLMGPGVDPHLYKPSFGDVTAIEEADVVFYSGLHLEAKMGEVFEQMANKKAIYGIADSLPEELLIESDVSGGTHDPHVWFDVDLWSQTVPLVREAMIHNNPENAEKYQENAAEYLNLLTDLQDEVKEKIDSLPEEKRILVTAHDAFGYFGEAYGFQVKGLQGISTASDYGLKDLENLVDFIVENQVKAIFVETSVSPKSIEAVKAGVLDKGWEVEIGGSLFSDAMGDPDTPEGTYEGMIRHNVNTIVDSLL